MGFSKGLRVSSHAAGERHPAEKVASKGSTHSQLENATETDARRAGKSWGVNELLLTTMSRYFGAYIRAAVEVTEDRQPVNEG